MAGGTESHSTEASWSEMIEKMLQFAETGCFRCDLEGRILSMHPAAFMLLHLHTHFENPEQVAGIAIWIWLPTQDKAIYFRNGCRNELQVR